MASSYIRWDTPTPINNTYENKIIAIYALGDTPNTPRTSNRSNKKNQRANMEDYKGNKGTGLKKFSLKII